MDDARLTRIEQRLAALEARLIAVPAGPPAPEQFWLLHALATEAAGLPGGAVAYGGQVRLPGGEEYAWQRTHGAEEVRAADPEEDDALAAALSALAHPVRLRLLREVLGGTTTTAALAALPGLGTTGQLHHHLRQLTTAGWLRTTARGAYGVPPERVVPLHVVLAAVSS
ncbi:helix-turn-helix domain-containing protein [Modestobacter roseus]|uniref:Helix-turn-helix protein n=1 Tax=Modestobacter roseus TaxID=1181884 RepID=A0A562ISZ5_9ACTN|nr:helix-turn-helix domain-containing protein [Modestobacter roseus]MQA33885.1 helix-turn-helix domain-containing protein [Modestobacter roseus]TWH73946.1 helix-turn-helix protein [Modestobacter roseus]